MLSVGQCVVGRYDSSFCCCIFCIIGWQYWFVWRVVDVFVAFCVPAIICILCFANVAVFGVHVSAFWLSSFSRIVLLSHGRSA